jgi:transposase
MLVVSRAASPLVLDPGQRELLESLAKSRTAEHRLVQRAQVLLHAACGVSNTDIAVLAGVTRVTVRAWRAEFVERGLADLGKVAEGRGRKASIPQAMIDQIVELTLHSRPEGAAHWSCRSMAAKVGVSKDTVQRVWDARELKPHLVETFKLSTDKRFEEKLVDVVGLYLNPPDQAVVSAWRKESDPGVGPYPAEPAAQARPGRHHDPRLQAPRHHHAVRRVERGDGQRHRQVLRPPPSRRVPVLAAHHRHVGARKLQIHLIVDNYGTHYHPNVKAWLAKHPRFHMHFTSTSSSWLNMVERWFAALTDKVDPPWRVPQRR